MGGGGAGHFFNREWREKYETLERFVTPLLTPMTLTPQTLTPRSPRSPADPSPQERWGPPLLTAGNLSSKPGKGGGGADRASSR